MYKISLCVIQKPKTNTDPTNSARQAKNTCVKYANKSETRNGPMR